MSSIQIIHEQIAASIQAERRQFQRVRAAVQIELKIEGTNVPIRVETSDISEGGCYVEMPLTLPKDAKLQILLWLGQDKLVFSGRVATSHPQFGNGIEFCTLSQDCTRKLVQYIDRERLVSDSATSPAAAVSLIV